MYRSGLTTHKDGSIDFFIHQKKWYGWKVIKTFINEYTFERCKSGMRQRGLDIF